MSVLTELIARRLFTFRAEEIAPGRRAILKLQGVPPRHHLSQLSEDLLSAAIAEAVQLADPKAVYEEIPPVEFPPILEGEGLNAKPNPVAAVADRAGRSLLFALTLGPAVSQRIHTLFKDRDPALGYMLDSAASVMAENLADLVQAAFEQELSKVRPSPPEAVMRYSPGYCGWHLSGQRRLFASLDPSSIGVSINESCLMSPIKSISGVMLAGEPRIHYFKNDFAFCEECQSKTCRARIRELSRKIRVHS